MRHLMIAFALAATLFAGSATAGTPEECYDETPIETATASLNFDSGKFSIRGTLNTSDVGFNQITEDDFVVSLATFGDGIFLAASCPLELVGRNYWRCTDGDTKISVRGKITYYGDRFFVFKVRGIPDWSEPNSQWIQTRVSFPCVEGYNDALWTGELGKLVRLKVDRIW